MESESQVNAVACVVLSALPLEGARSPSGTFPKIKVRRCKTRTLPNLSELSRVTAVPTYHHFSSQRPPTRPNSSVSGLTNIRSGIAPASSSAKRCASTLLALGFVSSWCRFLFRKVSWGELLGVVKLDCPCEPCALMQKWRTGDRRFFVDTR